MDLSNLSAFDHSLDNNFILNFNLNVHALYSCKLAFIRAPSPNSLQVGIVRYSTPHCEWMFSFQIWENVYERFIP